MDCCEKRENLEIVGEKNSKKCREYWIVVKSENWDKVGLKKKKKIGVWNGLFLVISVVN